MPKDLIRVNLDLLHPRFVELCLETLANCEARGSRYYWTSGFRSPAEQLALWQKGRDAAGAVVNPKAVVTKLKYGLHNAGIAGDFTRDSDMAKPGLQPSWNRADYLVLAEEAQKVGLEAGHFWKSFPDSPHLQLPIGKHNISVTMLRGLHAKGDIKPLWSFLDKNGPWGIKP